MKLTRKKIPAKFIETLPEGIKYVHRHGYEFLVVEQIMCPKGHSLIADSVKIHGEPSIRLQVKLPDQEGMVFVDAFWGSHAKLYSFLPLKSPEYEAKDICCSECGCSLLTDWKCDIDSCDSEQAVCLHLPGESRVYVCARPGCPGHHIEIKELPHKISEQVSDINYFGAHNDDLFQGI